MKMLIRNFTVSFLMEEHTRDLNQELYHELSNGRTHT